MQAPDISVRLTADGVQDVVNAFKRVQQESQNTREEVGLLGQAGEQLKDLLPVITIGAVVEGIVEMGKQALESTLSIGKLSEKVGSSAGTLSVLVMAANEVGVSQDSLSTALVKLSRNMENAANGSEQSKKAFQTLGVSMADIKSKSPADLFVEIAQKMQQMPDGATKSAVAMQLFGREGAALIPVMNEIGTASGFDVLMEKAKSVGLYLSDQMVADAKQAEEAMTGLQAITAGLALQFTSGFVPQMTGAIEDFTRSISGNATDSVKAFGDYVGIAIRGIVNVFLVAGKTIGATFASVFDGIYVGAVTIGSAVARLLAKDYAGVALALTTGSSVASQRQGQIWGSYEQDVSSIDWTKGATGTPNPHSSAGPSGDGETDAQRQKALRDREKLIDALAAYRDQVATAELQKQKARDQEYDAEDKALYQQGLITLSEYYTGRAALINQESDAEEAILKTKLQAQITAAAQLLGKSDDFIANLIQQGPEAVQAAAGANAQALAMLGKIAETKSQIDVDELKRKQQLSDNDAQRAQAQKEANAQELTDRQKLYELEGNTSAAQRVALQKELADTDALLTKLGVAEDQRNLILNRAAANASAKTQVGALSQNGSDAFASLDEATSSIQDKETAGAISQVAAETQIYSIEKQRLPALQAIAAAMQDVVDNNELQLLYLQPGTDDYNAQLQVVNNLQKQVDEYTKKVNALGISLNTTKSFSVELSDQLTTQGTQAAVTFFDDMATGSKTAAQAFADLGTAFEQIIVHMIDQMIVYYSLMALLGWLAPNSNILASLTKSGPFSGLTGHSAGGYTGNSSATQVAGVVHGQEFVFRAAATRQWGLPLLQAMNEGTISSIASGSSYGPGHIAQTAAEAGNEPMVQINIDTNGQPASQTSRQGSNGQNILDIVIGQVANDIASGGKTGQAIQRTYSVSRKGQVRG
jgi:hypothetical protein